MLPASNFHEGKSNTCTHKSEVFSHVRLCIGYAVSEGGLEPFYGKLVFGCVSIVHSSM